MDDLERRAFLGLALAGIPLAAAAQGTVQTSPRGVNVLAGQDRSGVPKGLGISTIDIKVATTDAGGGLFVIENTNRAKGGPARHLHVAQEELFYVVAGEYAFEIGADKFTLKAGDSLLAPRQVPHVWAYVGPAVGRMLVSFAPAGQMEAFFREVAKLNSMPPQDPALWRAHGMELLGPPLAV
ncbi:MAG: cupin domain-containing protein [Acidobacteriota bacterium]